MASCPITSWQIEGEKVEIVTDFIYSWTPKSLQTVTATMKLKDTCSLEDKQRHRFANKGPYNQSCGSPVVMYGCESWAIKKPEHRRTEIDAFELQC